MGLNEHLPSRPATAQAAPASVRVDIGELVLDGFAAGVDGDRVQSSFQDELARLVREQGLSLGGPVQGGAVLEALAGLPPLPAGLTSRRLGQELARAVHEGLTGQGTAGRGATANGRPNGRPNGRSGPSSVRRGGAR